MASNTVGEEWRRALVLLECYELEWDSLYDQRHKLTVSERISIEMNLESIQHFAAANYTNPNRISEFYTLYERIAVQFHLAVMKMKHP